MKKLTTVLILIGVLVLLIVVYAVIAHKNAQSAASDTTTSSETSVIVITDSKSDDICALSYTYNDKTISLTLTDGTVWKVEGDPAYPLDTTKPEAMAEAVAKVSAYRLIEENTSDFKQYGLDNPKYTIKVSYTDKTAVTYRIGSYISFTQSYYLNIEGDSKVYTVAKSLLSYFAYNLEDMQALDSVPKIDTDSITAIKIEEPDGSVFELLPDEANAGAWRSGGETFDTDKAADIVSAICNLPLKTLSVYGDLTEEELSAYGFDASHQTTVTISYYDTVTIPSGSDTSSTSGTKKLPRTFSFTIGAAVPDADPAAYYVQTSLSGMIYSVPTVELSVLFGN